MRTQQQLLVDCEGGLHSASSMKLLDIAENRGKCAVFAFRNGTCSGEEKLLCCQNPSILPLFCWVDL